MANKLSSWIEDIKDEIAYKKQEKYEIEMCKKYGDSGLETDDWKFIWGIKSWDDLTGADASMYTMNDIDIFYDKKKKRYYLGIETAYVFKSFEAECNYLRDCLRAFTKYMDDNGLDKNRKFILFMSNPSASISAPSIEELYMNFKIFVDGYCSQNYEY